jgi:hypothetical protein
MCTGHCGQTAAPASSAARAWATVRRPALTVAAPGSHTPDRTFGFSRGSSWVTAAASHHSARTPAAASAWHSSCWAITASSAKAGSSRPGTRYSGSSPVRDTSRVM